ncbi:acyltransferase [Pandoraea anhela]|uniref:Acyltransferase n=2 Tax=Pandoraea anhela TaxID=2508295 RepID=A0A5E4XWH9_9BURK|nr:acyltransferase [Pandoraea anhela]
MRNRDIPALTGLRFFAAFAIVVEHLWPNLMKVTPGVPYPDSFHQLAYLGMSLFFVLSGFIIHYNYSTLVSSARGLYDFAVARFSRLYPLFLALIVYDVICGNFILNSTSVERRPYIVALPYMLAGIQSWVYGFFGNHPITFPFHFTHVSWSISTEFFLYLTYPALCAVVLLPRSPKRAIHVAICVCAVSTLILWWVRENGPLIDRLGAVLGVIENPNADPKTQFSEWFGYIAPYPRVLEFFTGCAVAQAYMFLDRHPVSERERCVARILVIGAMAYIAMFVLEFQIDADWLTELVSAMGLLPAISIVMFCCARYDVKLLSWAPVVALGEASYSMYLLHMVIIEKSAPTVFVDPTLANILILSSRTVVILVAIALISLGMHRYFEQPMRRFLRRVLSRRSTTAPVAAQYRRPL